MKAETEEEKMNAGTLHFNKNNLTIGTARLQW